MDDKLTSTIDKITRLTQQNAEFDMELRKQLNVASANSVLSEDERINQIYEYCIEEIIRKQANEFYTDFPLQSIKDTLIGDFIRMESFRRKDNFGDFCLSLYQQIECITSRPLKSPFLRDIVQVQYLAYFLKHAQKSFHSSFEVICCCREKYVHSISYHTLIKVAAQTIIRL